VGGSEKWDVNEQVGKPSDGRDGGWLLWAAWDIGEVAEFPRHS